MAITDEYLPLDALLPDTANYNQHSGESVARLASQIVSVGFTAPFLVDAKTRLLAAGHRRRLALLKLKGEGHAEPEGVRPGWLVPCRVGEWSELQRLKVLVGDNPDPAALEYDTEQLTALLSELSNAGELEGSGYDEARLEALIGELAGESGSTYQGNGTGVDPNREWEGMPEFVQEDKTAFRTLHVHFADEEAVKEFQVLIGQEFSPEAKYIWHPRLEREDFMAFRYVANES